jgi:hypothetical protein
MLRRLSHSGTSRHAGCAGREPDAEQRISAAMHMPPSLIRSFVLGAGALLLAGCQPRPQPADPVLAQPTGCCAEPAPEPLVPTCEVVPQPQPDPADPCPACGRG